MFGFNNRRDIRDVIRTSHQKHYRRATHEGAGPSEAYERALLEIIAERMRDRRGISASIRSSVVISEAIPFLQLPGGKSLEVLTEYLAWREEGASQRMGYLRAMVSGALRSRRGWSRTSIRALSGSTLEQLGWFELLHRDLQQELVAVQGELRKRALQQLQQEAALAL